MAPDCEEIARRPDGTRAPATVAFRLTAGSVLSTPRELGPTMRTPAERTISSNCSWRARASSPASWNPVKTTSSALAPCSTASRATSSTSAAGTATTTSSGTSGSSPRPRATRTDRTTPPERWTGLATPWKPASMMLARSAPPTLPGSLDAPTTATEAGERIGRSDATAARWSRAAMRSRTCSVGRMSSERTTSPPIPVRRTSNPARLNTLSIGRLSARTSASKRSMPRSAAMAASCSSIRVAVPRP